MAPYLALCQEDAAQRDYRLREVFNGLRYIVRTGNQWRLMPRDLPPWTVVYRQMRRMISLAKTKTGKARRVPLNVIALQALQERKLAQPDAVYVFRDAARDPRHNCRRWFNEALAEAKIADCSWHCNRHTFASRLVMPHNWRPSNRKYIATGIPLPVGWLWRGVDLRTVAEPIGHPSIRVTMRYAQLAPRHDRAAVDRLVPAKTGSRDRKKVPQRPMPKMNWSLNRSPARTRVWMRRREFDLLN